MFFNIVRFDISDQMAAALANGFLTDFGIQRADSPEQRRIDPQEIAREKVRISTKLEQERNAEFHSSNQSISQLVLWWEYYCIRQIGGVWKFFLIICSFIVVSVKLQLLYGVVKETH